MNNNWRNQAGKPEGVSFIQNEHGYRDIIWCYMINEPAFIAFPDSGGAICPHCEWVIDEGEEPFFFTQHTFICHIGKPKHQRV